MKQFPDSASPPKTWTLSLNIGAVKRIRDLLKVDLMQLHEGDPPLIQRLTDDVVLVVDVLFVLCKPDADAAGITDEQFAGRLGGDAFRLAWEALQEELVDFFQQLGKPETAKVIRAQAKVVKTTSAAMDRKVVDLEAAALRMIDQKEAELDVDALILQSSRGKSSMALPESSA